MLQRMVLFVDDFDKGLIMLLRIVLANFIEANEQLQINGLPISFII